MSLKIDQAFIQAILDGGLAIDIVHENGSYSVWGVASYTHHSGVYNPNANSEYVEIRSFPAGTADITSNSDENVGLFQAIIKYPVDVAAITIKTKAEELLDLFTIGTPLTYDSQKTYPVSKSRDGGRIEAGFYQIVCRINYRAFVTR